MTVLIQGKRQPWHRLTEEGADPPILEAFRNIHCASYSDGEYSPGQRVGISAVFVRSGRREVFPTELREVAFLLPCWSLGKHLQDISTDSQLWAWRAASGRAGAGRQLRAQRMSVSVDAACGERGILNELLSPTWQFCEGWKQWD